jgi:hypothetical protein
MNGIPTREQGVFEVLMRYYIMGCNSTYSNELGELYDSKGQKTSEIKAEVEAVI